MTTLTTSQTTRLHGAGYSKTVHSLSGKVLSGNLLTDLDKNICGAYSAINTDNNAERVAGLSL